MKINSLYKASDQLMKKVVLWQRKRFESLSPENSQRLTLEKLLKKASDTEFGKEFNFTDLTDYKSYRERVPLFDYESMWREWWQRGFPLLENRSWPGTIKWFALSSGTTTGDTKYIPLSAEMLRSNQMAGVTLIGDYYKRRKGLYQGKFFYLGGSTALEKLADGIWAGDLSGIAMKTAFPLLRQFTFPPNELALMSNWEEKLQRLAEESLRQPITGISGVPSWVLLLLERIREINGGKEIREIWPDFHLLIHGGVHFAPYRKLMHDLLGEQTLFLETYPSSEGFIGLGDIDTELLRPMLGHGIFYEFIPRSEIDSSKPLRLALWEVETGVEYAIIISTCAGLWSYKLGDTVTFESKDPYLFRFSGRLKWYLSAFGEHLTAEEVDWSISESAEELKCSVRDYHMGPDFSGAGRHLLLMECEHDRKPEKEFFSKTLDDHLQKRNADYRGHRQGGIESPSIITLKQGAWREWMKQQGKLGGQHKVPRIDSSGEMTASILKWMEEKGYIG